MICNCSKYERDFLLFRFFFFFFGYCISLKQYTNLTKFNIIYLVQEIFTTNGFFCVPYYHMISLKAKNMYTNLTNVNIRACTICSHIIDLKFACRSKWQQQGKICREYVQLHTHGVDHSRIFALLFLLIFFG